MCWDTLYECAMCAAMRSDVAPSSFVHKFFLTGQILTQFLTRFWLDEALSSIGSNLARKKVFVNRAQLSWRATAPFGVRYSDVLGSSNVRFRPQSTADCQRTMYAFNVSRSTQTDTALQPQPRAKSNSGGTGFGWRRFFYQTACRCPRESGVLFIHSFICSCSLLLSNLELF